MKVSPKISNSQSSSSSSKQVDHDWEKLKDIEKQRRDLLQYDDSFGYKIVFVNFRRTIIQYILYDALFWVTMALYFFMRLFDHFYEDSDDIKESLLPHDSGVGSIGIFLSL